MKNEKELFVAGSLFFGRDNDQLLTQAAIELSELTDVIGESIIEFSGDASEKQIEIIKRYIRLLKGTTSYFILNGGEVDVFKNNKA